MRRTWHAKNISIGVSSHYNVTISGNKLNSSSGVNFTRCGRGRSSSESDGSLARTSETDMYRSEARAGRCLCIDNFQGSVLPAADPFKSSRREGEALAGVSSRLRRETQGRAGEAVRKMLGPASEALGATSLWPGTACTDTLPAGPPGVRAPRLTTLPAAALKLPTTWPPTPTDAEAPWVDTMGPLWLWQPELKPVLSSLSAANSPAAQRRGDCGEFTGSTTAAICCPSIGGAVGAEGVGAGMRLPGKTVAEAKGGSSGRGL